jgi:hypothetical protein
MWIFRSFSQENEKNNRATLMRQRSWTPTALAKRQVNQRCPKGKKRQAIPGTGTVPA